MTAQISRIVLAADHAGFGLKERIAEYLRGKGYKVEDLGCYDENSVDYPAMGQKLALALEKTPEDRGILCCGSGIGICIAANRFPWIRGTVVHDHFTAKMSRRHNDTNVASFGGRVIAPELACDLIDTWLAEPFEGGRHQNRVDMMSNMQEATPS